MIQKQPSPENRAEDIESYDYPELLSYARVLGHVVERVSTKLAARSLELSKKTRELNRLKREIQKLSITINRLKLKESKRRTNLKQAFSARL